MRPIPVSEPADGIQVAEAARLLADGIVGLELGHLSDAIARLESALAVLGLDEHGHRPDTQQPPLDEAHAHLTARILLSVAFPRHELGQREAALAALSDAERLVADEPDPEVRVLIHGQRGAMFLRDGQLPTSLAELNRAVAGLNAAPLVDQSKILINRGLLHGTLGQISAAKADCARALSLAQEAGKPDLIFYATHNLGLFEFLSGDLPRALELMPSPDEARSDFARGVVGDRPGQGAAQCRSAQRGRLVFGRGLRRDRPDRAGPVPRRSRAAPGRGCDAGRAHRAGADHQPRSSGSAPPARQPPRDRAG